MIRGFFERGSKKFEQPHRMRKSISRKHCLKFGVEVREPFHLVQTYIMDEMTISENGLKF